MSLAGKKVVFTGFRDADLKSQIESKGGKVVSNVSGLVDILIAEGEKAKNSEKMRKAQQKNLKQSF